MGRLVSMRYGTAGVPQAQLSDTGWIDALPLLTSDWTGYTDSGITEEYFSYRKYGSVCQLVGYIKPTRTLSTSSGNVLICELPEPFRPTANNYFVVQGAGINRARLAIQSDGSVYARAYGSSSNTNMTTSAFLFIAVMWLAQGGSGSYDDGSSIETYTGSYNVNPSFAQQTLATRSKRMSADVEVEAIGVSTTTNTAGGNTVYIGGEFEEE